MRIIGPKHEQLSNYELLCASVEPLFGLVDLFNSPLAA